MVCKMLHSMKRDEASGILEYNKLKNEMPPEHTEHIATLERIIGDEYDHLQAVEKIIEDMNCPHLSGKEQIRIIAREIYDKVNEIEKIARATGDIEKGERLHNITESIEHEISVIKEITKE